MYQTHVLGPAARRGAVGVFAEAARGGRPVAWTAIAVVALTGFYNVTRLGPIERVMETGAGLLLAGKFMLVLAAVALAAQRDFSQVPRLRRALRGRPAADGRAPHRAPELGAGVLRRLIAAEEEVAVDRLVGLGKLGGGNVMERADHLRTGKKRLSLFGG